MIVSRRKFLRTLVVGAGSVAAMQLMGCTSDSDSSTTPGTDPHTDPLASYFPHGVASGDPKPNSIILWTRLSEKYAEAADVNVGLVVWEAGKEDSPTVAVDNLLVSSDDDYCLRVKVEGLDSYTTYYYKFIYTNNDGVQNTSRQGRTKTALATSSNAKVKFALASCQDFIGRYYNSYLTLLQDHDDTDFILFIGDFIYETTGDPSFQDSTDDRKIEFTDRDGAITINGGEKSEYQAAQSLDNYREIYKTYRNDEILQEVLAKFPIIDIWDDHEFTDDAWQMYSTYDELATLKGKGTGDKAIDRCTNAMKAFIEYVPFDDSEWADTSGHENSIAAGKNMIEGTIGGSGEYHPRIHRSFDFGNTMKLVATDYRSFRPDHPIAEDTFPGHIMAIEAELNEVMGFEMSASGLKGDQKKFVKNCVSYCLWSDLGSEDDEEQNPNAHLKSSIYGQLVKRYIEAGFEPSLAQDNAEKALSNGLLSVPYLDGLISHLGLTIDRSVSFDRSSITIGDTQGIPFVTMGKSSLVTSFGTRYAASPKWYELYTLLRAGRYTEEGIGGNKKKVFGTSMPTNKTEWDASGLDQLQDWQNAWGEGQQTWVEEELMTEAKWRFVANSVSNAAMVVDLSTESIDRFLETYPNGDYPNGITDGHIEAAQTILGALGLVLPSVMGDDKLLISIDQWDGLPLARKYLQENVYKNENNNTILLSGDIHSSWVAEHNSDAGKLFEFTGASISSASASGLIEGIIESIEEGTGQDLTELKNFIIDVLDPMLVPDQPGGASYSFQDDDETMMKPELREYIENNTNLHHKNTSEHGIVIIEASSEKVETNYYTYKPEFVTECHYDNAAAFIEDNINHRQFRISGDAANRQMELTKGQRYN
ncbi:alkaline phosphatase D family protein [Moritella sp. 24]|uniref:alkaline phosphatase D family protein n=1 Tax=Moritella sp. 24 TaxID=2746230 RepID=UPI001BAC9D67|nr:alkaline phosphatase D family protein [Moritella sp. 24]QUM76033.1 alkaline phosphatase D family protein [Moritella sp. 24]